MKLLTKTSIIYLVFLLLLFFLVGLVFYNRLKNIISEDSIENLSREKEIVLQYIEDSAKIPYQSIILGDELSFVKNSLEIKEQLRDTFLFNTLEQEKLPYRQLVFPAKLNDEYYSVTISKPVFDSEDLLEAITDSLYIIAAVTIVLLLVFTQILSKNLWKPFYNTLDNLRSFDVRKKNNSSFPANNISEFKILNSELQKMTERIRADYMNLKVFTENASHEIQTPLAIILSKLEVMIQYDNLTEEQIKQIQDVYESAGRLSKLNNSLLLLSKIENLQFTEQRAIKLQDLIENKISHFADLIEYKNIRIDKRFNASPEIVMNQSLADIMFSNVIGNAIKHNLKRGFIEIVLDKNSVVISNPGVPLTVKPDTLFERFQKDGPPTDSPGLGLSIVKQVCDIYHFGVSYSYSEGIHSIQIKF